jgi:hypothetical protein
MNCGHEATQLTVQDMLEKYDTIQYELDIFNFCMMIDHSMVIFPMSWVLYEDDCFNVFPSIEDKSVDMILTDPPYMINYHTSRRCDKSHDFCSPIDNDNNPEIIKNVCYELNRILKEDSALYMFCSPNTC